MRLLCDTQIILWWLDDDKKLKRAAGELLADRNNEVLFSMVSLWEIALKERIGRLRTGIQAVHDACRSRGLTLLDIKVRHLAALSRLTDVLHNDPFDHLLIAQAMVEDVPLLTADRTVQRYPIGILKA